MRKCRAITSRLQCALRMCRLTLGRLCSLRCKNKDKLVYITEMSRGNFNRQIMTFSEDRDTAFKIALTPNRSFNEFYMLSSSMLSSSLTLGAEENRQCFVLTICKS